MRKCNDSTKGIFDPNIFDPSIFDTGIKNTNPPVHGFLTPNSPMGKDPYANQPCLWCGKSCIVKELDCYGRCGFDAQFSFDVRGFNESMLARDEIVPIMVRKGILP